MKKLLLLFAAAAMVLAFSMPAAAAEYVGHQKCCENCPKCDLDDIDCPTSGVTNEETTCKADYFDYDTESGNAGAVKTGAYGYDQTDSLANENCKVIFDICCCDASAIRNFTKGQTIGVRMTSLTDGFYFTADTVHIDIYEDDDTDCDSIVMQDRQDFPGPYEYRNAAGTVIAPASKTSTSCTVANKAVVLESEKDTGYQITQTDIDDSRCMWWFDMPAMRYDVNDATQGARVNVKIELLTAESGICGEWKVICECIVDLGVWCPEDEDIPLCMYFPYVITQHSTWSTGIVVTNLDTDVDIAEMKATFTLTDSAGKLFTYTKTDFDTKVWAFNLDIELPNFSGTPEPGPAWLKVETNFFPDGYSFMTDGAFGAGTLPRPCWIDLLEGFIR